MPTSWRDQALLPRPDVVVARPRDLQELALKVDRAGRPAVLDLHRQPSVQEIARAVEAPQEDVWRPSRHRAYRATSLESPARRRRRRGRHLGDTVGTRRARGFALAEARATLAALLRAVTPREREVLRLRFEEDLPQAEIGERIGVSQSRSRASSAVARRLRTVARTDDRSPNAAFTRRPPGSRPVSVDVEEAPIAGSSARRRSSTGSTASSRTAPGGARRHARCRCSSASSWQCPSSQGFDTITSNSG